MGFSSRYLPTIIKAPIEESRYLGMLVRVPDEAGTKTASIEKIQRLEEIFLLPKIKTSRKETVSRKSK